MKTSYMERSCTSQGPASARQKAGYELLTFKPQQSLALTEYDSILVGVYSKALVPYANSISMRQILSSYQTVPDQTTEKSTHYDKGVSQV